MIRLVSGNITTSFSNVAQPRIRNLKGDSKAEAIGKKALQVIQLLGMILVFPLTITAAVSYRVYSHFRSDLAATKEALAERRYKAIKDLELTEDFGCSPENPCKKAIRKIDSLIRTEPKKGHFHNHMQKIREAIDTALQTDYYKQERDDRDNYLVSYLQEAAHRLTACAPGMEELREYGAKMQTSHCSTYEDFAKALDDAVDHFHGFEKNNLVQNVFWSIAHPQKAWSSLRGHSKSRALKYNSYKHGNANMRVATFTVGQMNMHLNLGPTPTSDRLFEAHLKHLEKKRQKHLQQDFEFAHRKGEKQRREAKIIMSEEHKNLTYFSTPLDGVVWKGDLPMLTDESDFFEHLGLHMQGEGSSFHLPEDVADDKKEVLGKAQKAFGAVENGSYAEELKKTKAGRVRLDKARLLGFEAIYAVKEILRTSENYEGDAFMGQACKQDIDRGVLVNVMTILFMEALANPNVEELSMERVQELVGMVLVRAGMVDARAILEDRFEALSDLLHLIGDNPKEFLDAVRELNSDHFDVSITTEI